MIFIIWILSLPEVTNYNIGKFEYMRCEYLKEFKYGYIFYEKKLHRK